MSSRIYRAGNGIEAAAIVWRAAGGSTIQGQRPSSIGLRGSESRGGAGESSEVERAADVEARVRAAYQEGLAAGEAAGSQGAAQRLEPVLAGFAGMIQELSTLRKRLRVEAEADLVQLAIAIARRVLHREIATDPEAILGLVKAAFAKLNARETHRLRVAPADAAAIRESRAFLELPEDLEIHADASLTRGSAIFETSRGELDGSVNTQLAEIERGLADVMRRKTK